MSTELKTNTAVRITVGPFLDKTDGITPEVSLTATNEKLTLVVDTAGVPTLALDANATASAGNNDMVHVTNDDAGYYDLELTAANLNYVGNAKLAITYATDHLPVFHELNIVSAQYWDAKYGTGNFSADVIAISGDATAANNAESFFDGTGYAGTNNVIPTVTTVTNQLTAAAVATGVWKDATAGDFTDASSIGKALYIANVAPGASGGHMISGTNAGTTTLGAMTVTGALTTGSIVNGGVFTQTGTHTISALTVTNAMTVGTNAIPWNAAYDAEVESECQDALVVNNLDHLMKVAAVAGDAVDSSIIARITSKSATPSFASFDNTTDSLEANRDNIGTTGAAMTIAAVTGNVGGTVATVTNLTNAPTNGDLTATMKTSVQTASDAALVANNLDHIAKTATAAADMTTEVADNTILSRILSNGDTSAFDPSTDGLQLIRDKLPANFEDLAVTDTTGLVSVGTTAAGAINNAAFNADVGSTAFATNIIALAVFKALDSAIGDAVSLTADGLLDKMRTVGWIIRNKITVTDANGNTVIYKDDNSTAAFTVNAALTDDSTTTTRLRMA
jgi:hypothetical protein